MAKVKVKSSDLRARFQAVQEHMRTYCIAQDELIDALQLAVLSGNHCLLYGPWGVNKTGTINLFTRLLGCDTNGSSLFTCSLDKYSAPEVLLGPISAKALLEEDKYVRNLAGTICEAPFAFVGEVFSGNSATRRSLLSVINEGYIDNGGKRHPVKLLSMFCDSNELPTQRTDSPFFDRILFRVKVEYIPLQDVESFMHMLDAPQLNFGDAIDPVLSLQEVRASRIIVGRVKVPDIIKGMLHEVRSALVNDNGIVVSDRRWKRSINVLRAAAWMRGSAYIEPCDLYALRHVLWEREEHINAVREKLAPYKGKSLADGERTAVADARRSFEYAMSADDPRAIRQAYESLVAQRETFVTEESLKELDEMIDKLRNSATASDGAKLQLENLMDEDVDSFEELCDECGAVLPKDYIGSVCASCKQ